MASSSCNNFALIMVKVLVDLNFALNAIPLRRSARVDILIEPAVRYPVGKYVVWIFHASLMIAKLNFFVNRCVTEGLTALSILHFIIFVEMTAAGAICSAAVVFKSKEAIMYFHSHYSLCRRLFGELLSLILQVEHDAHSRRYSVKVILLALRSLLIMIIPLRILSTWSVHSAPAARNNTYRILLMQAPRKAPQDYGGLTRKIKCFCMRV